MCGGVDEIITGNKFHQNRSMGFRATGIRKLGYLIDLQQFRTTGTVLTVSYTGTRSLILITSRCSTPN